MKNRYKYLILFSILLLLIAALFWQYGVSKTASSRDLLPMRIGILLEPMNTEAEGVALNTKFVYIGSSNQTVAVSGSTVEDGRVRLVLLDKGIIYDDSAIFAGQRLVFNTKTNVHALFDSAGTVTSLEYIK